MPSFNTEVSHQLGKEQATEKLKKFLELVAKRYQHQVSQLDGNWNDNILDFSLTTYGFKVSGTLTVEEDLARLEGDLPFAAVAFKGKIQQGIANELQRALV